MTSFHKMLPDRPRYFPNELIKPHEARDAFIRDFNANENPVVVSNPLNHFPTSWFINWLEENHFVIVKDPTR